MSGGPDTPERAAGAAPGSLPGAAHEHLLGRAPRNRHGAAPGEPRSFRSVDVLGVRVDDVTYDETIALVDRFIAEGTPHVITTPNPEFVMVARAAPDFRALLDRAALNIPDGVGLLLAARLFDERFREHVRGTDLVERLAAHGARRGHRWYLLGAADGVAAEAARRLRTRHPDLQIVGAAPGSPAPADDEATRAAIAAAGPVDLILVAYGAPAQERWLERNLGPLGIPVGIGVGGVFNFLSGRVPRAPRWVQRLELEWLHRLLVQPWRWRRQLALPRFLLLAVSSAAARALGRWPHRSRHIAPARPPHRPDG